ncbi:hypothetical protein DY000_02044987 [Brassica cretica]|uniref:DUF4408 domain-containing protein n=1 Tax=Brassica cretica TaxID=69181 RepID=A0ABQ7F1P1_BRACR|nr:hypothetical protein DY000_02044987 [Brassica cretica]
MASPMSTIKVAVVSTIIIAMTLFVKSCVPIVVELSSSRFPILWSSFLTWLKPPYLFVIINVIIVATIVASSKYFQSTGDQDCEVKNVEMDGHFVATFPQPIVVTDVDRSKVVGEEKEEEEEETFGRKNGGDEFVMLTWKLNKLPTMVEESETKKPLVSARLSYRKPVKVTSKGNKRKASRVVKPKWHESTWKMMVREELESTPLTHHSWGPETLRLEAGELQPVLRESETFRDITNNYPISSTVTPPVKMKNETSPSLEELNRKCEAFIKKGKEEIVESLRLGKDVYYFLYTAKTEIHKEIRIVTKEKKLNVTMGIGM